jgi:uncharacterized protein YjaG (DUF416 family)
MAKAFRLPVSVPQLGDGIVKDFAKLQLGREIEQLTKGKQLFFSLLLCERMAPALNKFATETGFDNSIYRTCLETAWLYLDQNRSSSNYGEMAERCFDKAPDTEVFTHPLTSAALNAALSIAATIALLADDDVNHVMEAASLARDTAALYAQAIETTQPHSLDFGEIMKHPLVQRELRQQAEDLEFLEAFPANVSQGMIPLIKERAAGTPALLPPERMADS